MAKKATKKAAPKKAANKNSSGVKAVAKKLASTLTPNGSKAALDEEQIGHAAGEVWNALHSGGPATVASLKKQATASGDATLMAIGWLAREGKLHFDASDRTVKVSLRG